jgi:uncharacterized protein (DUF433 family)
MATEMHVRRTEHPHVVQVDGVCGGRPTIEGTRISIDTVAQLLAEGLAAEEIIEFYPSLNQALVHDAISYYHDHKAEIDRSIAENSLEASARREGFAVAEDGRILDSAS